MVSLIIGVLDACRSEEKEEHMGTQNVEDKQGFTNIGIPTTKTKQHGEFTVTEGSINYRKFGFVGDFMKICSFATFTHLYKKFLLSIEMVNSPLDQLVLIVSEVFLNIPIGEFLKLSERSEYTGHCLRM